MKNRIFCFNALLLFHLCVLNGQDIINLANPSFDFDSPYPGKTPLGWKDLGGYDFSPTDIQPGFYECIQLPQDGNCYVGMVVRDNDTWEGIEQSFWARLRKGESYTFSIWLATSAQYISYTPNCGSEKINYDAPVICRIWGTNTFTGTEELLAETGPITHQEWENYTFVLSPQDGSYNEIALIVYYAPGFENICGNLLIDNCSAIVRIK